MAFVCYAALTWHISPFLLQQPYHPRISKHFHWNSPSALVLAFSPSAWHLFAIVMAPMQTAKSKRQHTNETRERERESKGPKFLFWFSCVKWETKQTALFQTETSLATENVWCLAVVCWQRTTAAYISLRQMDCRWRSSIAWHAEPFTTHYRLEGKWTG